MFNLSVLNRNATIHNKTYVVSLILIIKILA